MHFVRVCEVFDVSVLSTRDKFCNRQGQIHGGSASHGVPVPLACTGENGKQILIYERKFSLAFRHRRLTLFLFCF